MDAAKENTTPMEPSNAETSPPEAKKVPSVDDTLKTVDEPVNGDETTPTDVETKAPSDAEAAEDDTAASKREATADSLPKRPVKRARTAYFIFADEKRPEVVKEHQGEGVTAVARALGQIWAAMTDEDKQVYQDQAAEERTRVADELEAWKAAGGVLEDLPSKSPNNSSSLVLPVARIRKICKLDPDVRGLSKEAVLLVTKAAELALAKLGGESVRVAQIQNRRKLLPEDVASVCSSREQFLFLREDIADLTRLQQKEATKAVAAKSLAKNDAPVEQSASSKLLTSFFTAKPKD